MHIGEDIIDEILSRVPVKSLLRFKLVCKDWYFHINSHRFVTKHIKNQTTNQKTLIYHTQCNEHKFVVSICSEQERNRDDNDDREDGDSRTLFHEDQQYCIKDMLSDYCNYYKDAAFQKSHSLSQFLNHLQKMSSNYMSHSVRDVCLIGTCNGLVCLSCTNRRSFDDMIITLWNPATRDFKTLPSWEPQCRGSRQIGLVRAIRYINHIGFGFDCTSNDYKVLRVVESLISQAAIYSFNTNSWRELEYSNVSAQMLFVGIYGYTVSLCENVYWVTAATDMLGNPVLLSFDMGKEVFQFAPLPLSVNDPDTVEFLTLHESIALFFHEKLERTIEIWTTKEFGQGRASWTKVFNIGHSLRFARPLGFQKCKNSDGFLFYISCAIDSNWKKNAMKGIYINDRGEIKNGKMMSIEVNNNIVVPLKVLTYVETLASVNKQMITS